MPYLIGLFSGLLFGAIAWRAKHSIGLWGIGGAIFGLTLATIVIGVSHAATVPYSDEVIARYYWISSAVSTALVVVAAGVMWFAARPSGPVQAAAPEKQDVPPKA